MAALELEADAIHGHAKGAVDGVERRMLGA
jgi:hypothetical protein